jgi:hypothetical protein
VGLDMPDGTYGIVADSQIDLSVWTSNFFRMALVGGGAKPAGGGMPCPPILLG